MGERKALGKGLAALLGQRPADVGDSPSPPGPAPTQPPQPPPEDAGASQAPRVGLIPVSRIEPNPDQPREHIDDAALQDLARSITRDGVIQPIVVRKHGEKFQLIAGERRWRAARLAGLEVLPALVHTLREPTDGLRLALVENIQRQDLNPLEEARAYRELIQRCGLTQEQLAEQVSKSRTTVTNTLRLLNLPADLQTLLAQGKLTMGHARALLAADTESAQRKVAKAIVADGLSVREAERLTSGAKATPAQRGGGAAKRPASADPHYAQLERTLRERLGTKVQITRTGPASGRITIEYYSSAELEGLLERFGLATQE